MTLAGDFVKVLVDGYELTGDSHRIVIDDQRALHDVTTLADLGRRYVPGPRTLALEHAGHMNAAASASHPVLRTGAVQGAVSVLLGMNAAPVVGDPVYCVYARQGQYTLQPAAGQHIPFGARFANAGSSGGWGTVLTPPVSFTNTTTGTSVDNGRATSDGGAAFLHVLQAAASDTYAISLEGSPTGAFTGEQEPLATFTLNASALGSERQVIGGAIPRYMRWKATRTGAAGNTVRIAVNLVRNLSAKTYIERTLTLLPGKVLAYLPLYETAGTTAADLSGYGRNGTYNGVTLNNTTAPDGSPAARWDGTNDLATMPSIGLPSQSFSLSLWAKPETKPQQAMFGVAGSIAPYRQLHMQMFDNGYAYFGYNNGSTFVNLFSSFTIPFDVWHHYVFTFDNSTNVGRIYLDGLPAGSATLGPFGDFGTPSLTIGADFGGIADFFKGNIAHVAIWDTVLTAAQAQALATI